MRGYRDVNITYTKRREEWAKNNYPPVEIGYEDKHKAFHTNSRPTSLYNLKYASIR